MSSFRQTKKEAWKYYRTWMKEKTLCSALKKEVRITRKGWDHIIDGSKSKRRRVKDKHLRLSLLKSAKFIIKNASEYLVERRNGISYMILEGSMVENKNKKVKVVLKTDKKGNINFFSVMRK